MARLRVKEAREPVKALVVDDDPDILDVVSVCLQLRWPDASVLQASNAVDALATLECEKPDIIILDLGLPDTDGLEVCKTIRRSSDVPIVMLTIRDQPYDVVRGLEAGADDYVTKPFEHMELLARVNAVLRRVRTVPPDDESVLLFNGGELSVGLSRREVKVRGKLVGLTPTEYSLLHQLVTSAGKVVSHEQLIDRVWGPAYRDQARNIKVHMSHLRSKLMDDAEMPRIIATEPGSGYRFVAKPANQS